MFCFSFWQQVLYVVVGHWGLNCCSYWLIVPRCFVDWCGLWGWIWVAYVGWIGGDMSVYGGLVVVWGGCDGEVVSYEGGARFESWWKHFVASLLYGSLSACVCVGAPLLFGGEELNCDGFTNYLLFGCVPKSKHITKVMKLIW